MDIKLDADNDIVIQNGDILLGESQQQEVEALLYCQPGNLKNAPKLGAGVQFSRGGRPAAYLVGKIKRHLKADGKEVERITFDNNQLQIELK